jgi:hypothetical protein
VGDEGEKMREARERGEGERRGVVEVDDKKWRE